MRNQVPEAMLLSSDIQAIRAASYVCQNIQFGESNQFTSPLREALQHSAVLPLDLGSLQLNLEEGLLCVSYQYCRSQGVPERHVARQAALRLCPGQWGRVLYNGRHTDYDEGSWWYERKVLNIGLFDEVKPYIFLNTTPTNIFSQMEKLW